MNFPTDVIVEMSGRGPQGIPGDVYFPYFVPDMETGHLLLHGSSGYDGITFRINNNNGHLEAVL